MSDGDDADWFEEAVRRRRESEGSDESGDDDPAAMDDDVEAAPNGGSSTDAWDEFETADAPDDGNGPDDGDDGDEADVGGSGLFDDDFGAAMGDIRMPDPGGGDDAIGSGSGFDADGSVGEFDPGEFDMGDGGEFEVGGGDLGGSSFDDEEIDSEIPRIDLGITGLDEMIQGGVPERSLMVTIGSAGTGKTTFGLQFLNEALENGERAIFVTLEESSERVVNSAVEKGMPFDEYVDENRLAVVDIDPIEMANSLGSIRSDLPRLIEQFGATRLVLDSVSLLEMMYDSRSKRRTEVYDFTQSLKNSGITTMLTSEASEDSPFVSRHGIVEYLTDAVFILQYVRPSDFRETRLAVEIQKIRDANHSRETKPYEITGDGISVHRQANIF